MTAPASSWRQWHRSRALTVKRGIKRQGAPKRFLPGARARSATRRTRRARRRTGARTMTDKPADPEKGVVRQTLHALLLFRLPDRRLDAIATVAAALLVVVSRFAFLANGPWEWDETLFARGILHFDLAAHFPHPPGFPGWLAIGHLLTPAVGDPLRALQVGVRRICGSRPVGAGGTRAAAGAARCRGGRGPCRVGSPGSVAVLGARFFLDRRVGPRARCCSCRGRWPPRSAGHGLHAACDRFVSGPSESPSGAGCAVARCGVGSSSDPAVAARVGGGSGRSRGFDCPHGRGRRAAGMPLSPLSSPTRNVTFLVSPEISVVTVIWASSRGWGACCRRQFC